MFYFLPTNWHKLRILCSNMAVGGLGSCLFGNRLQEFYTLDTRPLLPIWALLISWVSDLACWRFSGGTDRFFPLLLAVLLLLLLLLPLLPEDDFCILVFLFQLVFLYLFSLSVNGVTGLCPSIFCLRHPFGNPPLILFQWSLLTSGFVVYLVNGYLALSFVSIADFEYAFHSWWINVLFCCVSW